MTIRRFVATGLALAMAALLVSGTAAAEGKPAPTAKVNLNTASVEQLTALPGGGPKLAAASFYVGRLPTRLRRCRILPSPVCYSFAAALSERGYQCRVCVCLTYLQRRSSGHYRSTV
jgi:hypothetical protein